MDVRYESIEELIKALITSYYKERSVEKTLTCVTENVKWIGTENGEIADGKEELHSLLCRDVADFEDSFEIRLDKQDVQVLSKDVVYVTVEGHQVEVPGVICGFTVRGTMTAVYTEKDGWLIANIHVSVPNSEMEKYNLSRELDEKRLKEQTLMAGIPGGVAVYRLKKDGKVTTDYVSESLATMCGYTDREFLAYLKEDASVNIVADDKERVIQNVMKCIQAGVPISVNYRIYQKNHQQILIRLDANVIRSEKLEDDDIAILYAVHTRVSDESMQIIEDQKRLKALIDEVPAGIGIYECTRDTITQVYMNDAFYRLTGSTREARKRYAGKNTLLACHPDDLSMVHEEIGKLFDGLNQVNFSFRVNKEDGGWFWLNMIAVVVERKEDWIRIYASFTDNNEIKRVEFEYEERLRLDKASAKDAVAISIFNLTKNCVSEISTSEDSIKKILGSGTADEVLFAICDYVKDEIEKNNLIAIRGVKSLISGFENGITHVELRHRLKGDHRWFLSTFDMISNPYSGDIEAIGVLRDATEAVRSELVVDQLIKIDYQTILLLDNITGCTVPFRTNQKEWNLEHLLSKQRTMEDPFLAVQEIIGKLADPAFVEQTIAAISPKHVKEMLAKEPFYEYVYMMLYQGKRSQYRLLFSYLGQDKNIILVAIQDVTAIYEEEEKQKNALAKALKEAEAANHSKTDFLSRMSHDMRTPMNAILGLSALTLDDAEKPEVVRENMGKMRQAGDFMLGLINDILDMARIEDGAVTFHMEPYTYSDFLMNMKTMFLPQCEAKGINIHFVEPVHRDPTGLTDKIRINQIFFNIFSNAVKYTPTGGSINCTVQNIRLENGKISGEYVIADTGIGMSESFQKNLFNPFSQEDATVTPELQGSGLGLSITKQLVERMGGHISITSKKGVGTTVVVGLSFELVEPVCVEDTKNSKAVSEDELVGKHVLLVEDHPLNAQIARKLLEKKEMVVVYAENGQVALDKFAASEEGDIDVILMDIRMPVMNGYDSTKAIRALTREDATSVPIIAMSANAYDEDLKEGKEAGMTDYLTKPVDPEILYKTLLKYVSKS